MTTSQTGQASVIEKRAAGMTLIRHDPRANQVITFSYTHDGQLSSQSSQELDGSHVVSSAHSYASATGQPTSVAQGGVSQQSYVYYPSTHPSAGRVQSITHHLTSGYTDLEYNDLGQETRRTGTGSYPVERSYTAYGEPETLITWRTEGESMSQTTWAYQEATGMLLSKRDNTNLGTTYTYDAAGRIKTRTNARGIVTTYSYDQAGRLTHTDYSDSTPDVTVAHDRAGRTVRVTDATGTRQLGYQGALPGGQESSIQWAGTSSLPQWEFSRTQTDWWVKRSGSTQAQLHKVNQQGRLLGMQFAGDVNVSVVAEYNLGKRHHDASESGVVYHGGAGTLAGLHWPGTATYPLARVEWRYDQDSDDTIMGTAPFLWLESDRWNPAVPLKEQRSFRSSGVLTPLTHNTAVDVPQELKVSYNTRGEVARTTRMRGMSTAGWSYSGPLLPGGSQRWTYDDIGNLTQSSASKPGATLAQATANTEARQNTGYTANALNQYATISRDNPLLRLIQGTSITQNVTVKLLQGTTEQALTVAQVVAGQPAFVAEAAVDVSAGAQWRKLRVQSSTSGITATREGWLFFPPQMETLAYDADGNLTSDARWTYTYDAENQLTSMEEKVIANGPARKRLEFTYDHLHRRVRKVVKSFSSTTSTFVLTKERRFIYDGWNMVAELDASPLQPGGAAPSLELLRAYAWGNDLSGTPQGAGGVGGLLMIQERDLRAKRGGLPPQIPAVYAPIYDFNGNVLNYVELNRGEGLTHTFDYDAFGRELTADTLIPSGDTSPPESLPIKFSTKYHDEETGLAYYGHRYYNPELGRWINRDPIGERGGLNLYGMVGNDAVNRWDVLGMFEGSGGAPGPDGTIICSKFTDRNGPPKTPGPSDHLFPPLGLDAGSHNYNGFFERMYGPQLEDLKEKAKVYIEAAIKIKCDSKPTSISGWSEEYTFTPQTWFERNAMLGSTPIIYRNISIAWGCKCFSWSAEMAISDGLGFDNDPEGMLSEVAQYYVWGSGNPVFATFPDRAVERGKWRLSGYGSCD